MPGTLLSPVGEPFFGQWHRAEGRPELIAVHQGNHSAGSADYPSVIGNRSRRVRRAAAVLTGAVVAFVPSAAWGHPEFVTSTSVPARSDQKLTLNVPEEKGPDIHTTKVVFVVPAGFTVSGCDQKPEWGCGVARGSEGRTLVTYTRASGANPDGRFSFAVRTPDKGGEYAFPTNQSYSDNTTVRWAGPPNSDNPAPVLKVT